MFNSAFRFKLTIIIQIFSKLSIFIAVTNKDRWDRKTTDCLTPSPSLSVCLSVSLSLSLSLSYFHLFDCCNNIIYCFKMCTTGEKPGYDDVDGLCVKVHNRVCRKEVINRKYCQLSLTESSSVSFHVHVTTLYIIIMLPR